VMRGGAQANDTCDQGLGAAKATFLAAVR
jgi:hypothetical protein